MKQKVLLFVLWICVTPIVAAQADPQKGFAEVNFGWMSHANIDNVSLFGVGSANRVATPLMFTRVGYNGWSIAWGINPVQTEVDSLNETAGRNVVLVGIGDAHDISDRLQLTYRLEFGLLAQTNTYRYAGKDYSNTRYGIDALVSFGLNYKINERRYVGLMCNALDIGVPMSNAPELPAGLSHNPRINNGMFGCSLMFVLGSKF